MAPVLNRKLLLFDIDGTILGSGGAGIRALEAAAQEVFGTTDLHDIEIAGRTDAAIVRQLYGRIGREPEPEEFARFYDLYLTHLAHFLPITEGTLLPGIFDLLDELRSRPHCVLALLTGNLERGARLKLSHYGVWHYFEFGAYADDSPDRNALGPVAVARARANYFHDFPPEHIFVLGDTPHDVACARAFGAKAIAVATGRHTRAELAATAPDFLFDDFSDVPAVLRALGL